MCAVDVSVIGLGRIGLPVAALLATSGYTVHGVDIDEAVLQRASTREEPGLADLLRTALGSGCLRVSVEARPASTYLIAVPTLLDATHSPDLSHLDSAIASVLPHLRAGNLLLIESTCPIGTTERIARRVRAHLPSVEVAYCPERVFPGQILQELIYNDRVVGGVDRTSTDHAAAFYRSFVRGSVVATDARTAEAVKLAENSYRDINIAYANELSMIADHHNLDVHEVIRLTNRHPRAQILQPGPGVGGHCIPVTSHFLAASAGGRARLIAEAREVNRRKSTWALQKIRAAIARTGAQLVACLGLTYKPDVPDTTASPALAIVESLRQEAELLVVDPYLPNTFPLEEALERADLVVGLVGHSAFREISPSSLKEKNILDFVGFLDAIHTHGHRHAPRGDQARPCLACP